MDAQEPPWRVVRAFSQENGGTLVHLHNVSGGILSGDHLTLHLDVRAGAIAQVTTTGATRLYRHRPGQADSQQHVHIDIREGALLEYLPDPLIPFGGSRHLQQTSINMEKGATLLWWETLAPGRHAMGETFAFDRLELKTAVRSSRRPLLIENILLQPGERALSSPARLGAYTHAANFYAFHVGLPSAKWTEIEAKLNEFCRSCSRPGAMIWGASALVSDGIAVRGLSLSAREIPATLAAIWTITKQFLTGEDPVRPRKVY